MKNLLNRILKKFGIRLIKEEEYSLLKNYYTTFEDLDSEVEKAILFVDDTSYSVWVNKGNYYILLKRYPFNPEDEDSKELSKRSAKNLVSSINSPETIRVLGDSVEEDMWHSRKESPEIGKWILYESQINNHYYYDTECTCAFDFLSYSGNFKDNMIRWIYIEDLLSYI